MANNPSNIRLGPCRVRWGGIDLGLTKGGVQVEVQTSTKEVTVDQYGEAPVNEYITSRSLTVTAPFAETDIDTLHTLMSGTGSTMVGDGAKASGSITIGTGNAANNDTVTVNGVIFTFKTTPTALRDVRIGASEAATALNLLYALQTSTSAAVVVAYYSLDTVDAKKVNINYALSGTAGNSFTLAKTSTNVTVSGATLAGGTAATAGRRVEVTSSVGTSLYTTAKELLLRPSDRADNDFSEDFVVPIAGVQGNLTFAYQLNDERLFNLTFKGYPNTVTGLLFIYGDKR